MDSDTFVASSLRDSRRPFTLALGGSVFSDLLVKERREGRRREDGRKLNDFRKPTSGREDPSDDPISYNKPQVD